MTHKCILHSDLNLLLTALKVLMVYVDVVRTGVKAIKTIARDADNIINSVVVTVTPSNHQFTIKRNNLHTGDQVQSQTRSKRSQSLM
jgi:hypothetical protein